MDVEGQLRNVGPVAESHIWDTPVFHFLLCAFFIFFLLFGNVGTSFSSGYTHNIKMDPYEQRIEQKVCVSIFLLEI